MYTQILKAKIHRATVTDADLYYEGSLTIDYQLMEKAGMVEHEKVHVVNINNGNRLETYLIKGEPDSGTICLNGAAARLGHRGDQIIIISYGLYSPEEAKNHTPTVVLLDENNKIKE
ncbi:MAG: aspartate 1-decarboxylase [Leptospirales bacterium]